MINVSQDEAKQNLAELIEAALHGEQIIITREAQHVVQLVPYRCKKTTGTLEPPKG